MPILELSNSLQTDVKARAYDRYTKQQFCVQ